MPRPVEILAERVAERIEELGTNSYAVSLAASGKGDLVRDIMRGRMPNAARLAELAIALKTTTQWLLGGASEQRERPATDAPQQARTAVQDGARAFTPPPFNPRMLPKNIPVFTGALGTAFDFSNGVPIESQVMDLGESVDMVRRPPGIADAKGVYALYIVGDSQSPRYESGELIFVHPHRPVAIGDDVVVQLVDDDDSVVCALVKRLMKRTTAALTLRQFNPPASFEVPQVRIRAIHRVLTNADLWGF